MNNVARRAMNKGMNIDKILRFLSELTSTGQVKLNAGFIIGLPGDTIDDMYKTFDFCKDNPKLFRSWNFSSLQIYGYSEVEKISSLISPLERDPEKYGYTITEIPNETSFWKNEFMTSVESLKTAATLLKQSHEIMKCGGWSISSAWHNNVSDYDIDNKTTLELKLDGRGRQVARERAILTVKKYT
jgi:radical SAM superfamily enzyme YgiQ (UPF0313 family)